VRFWCITSNLTPSLNLSCPSRLHRFRIPPGLSPLLHVVTPNTGHRRMSHRRPHGESRPAGVRTGSVEARLETSPESRRDVLANAVIRALQPGNGRSNRCQLSELSERLESDGVTCTPEDLAATITRLADCGQLIRVQRQPHQAYPQYLIHTGDHSYDEVDALAADVSAVLKSHDEQFESEEELCLWLDEAGIEFTSDRPTAALQQLERIGQLGRPRQDHWRADLPLPGWYIEPRIHNEQPQ
jgi:hypothetical protein